MPFVSLLCKKNLEPFRNPQDDMYFTTQIALHSSLNNNAKVLILSLETSTCQCMHRNARRGDKHSERSFDDRSRVRG